MTVFYVPSLPVGQGAELGHKHFQHPKRSAADFGPEMDRFSFIVIDLSLRAIAHDPEAIREILRMAKTSFSLLTISSIRGTPPPSRT